MPGIFCDPIELDQSQFDFLMGIVAAQLARFGAEGCADVIYGADHHIEEAALAGRLVIGDGTFQQMAHRIHFVQVA
ncbi:hypothetical protein D3C87_1743630 [compost metagenome]